MQHGVKQQQQKRITNILKFIDEVLSLKQSSQGNRLLVVLVSANALRTRKVDVYFLSRPHALSRANALRTRKVYVYFLSRVHALYRANALRTSIYTVFYLPSLLPSR